MDQGCNAAFGCDSTEVSGVAADIKNSPFLHFCQCVFYEFGFSPEIAVGEKRRFVSYAF